MTTAVTTGVLLLYSKLDTSGLDGIVQTLVAFSFLPVLYWLKDWIITNLRWQLKNREYAIVMNLHSILNAVLVIFGAYIGGIIAAITGIYVAYAISIGVGFFFINFFYQCF